MTIRHDVADTGRLAGDRRQPAREALEASRSPSCLDARDADAGMLPIAASARCAGHHTRGRRGSPSRQSWVFRFFPGDNVVKVAHARYVGEALGQAAPAII